MLKIFNEGNQFLYKFFVNSTRVTEMGTFKRYESVPQKILEAIQDLCELRFYQEVLQDFYDMLFSIDEGSCVIIHKNIICSVNSSSKYHSFDSNWSYIEVERSQLKKKMYNEGLLHCSDGCTSIIFDDYRNETHLKKDFYIFGTKIPSDIIDEGLVIEDELSENDLVTVELYKTNNS